MSKLRVGNPDELAAALPHLLGFQPEESLVVIPFGNVDGRLPVARVDLPVSGEAQAETSEVLLDSYMLAGRADSTVALVCVCEDAAAAEAAAAGVGAAFEEHGVAAPVRLWVSEQAWTDLQTGVGGDRTVQAQTRIATERVAQGQRMPAPSRESLAEAFRGDPEPVAAKLSAAAQRALSHPQPAERAWVGERVDRFEADGQRLSDPEAARMLVAVQDVACRDDVLARMGRENATEQRALWTDLTARAPQDVRTPAATLSGFAAWLEGDGAGAWTALDQRPAGEPYRAADLLGQMLREGVPPQAWDDAAPPLSSRTHEPPLTAVDPPQPAHRPDPPSLAEGPPPGPQPPAP